MFSQAHQLILTVKGVWKVALTLVAPPWVPAWSCGPGFLTLNVTHVQFRWVYLPSYMILSEYQEVKNMTRSICK
jgi:hypothetical protein